VRALLDGNVLITGLLARTGAPARLLLGKWLEGEFELVVTERLLAELEATLARPKLLRHFDEAEVSGFLELLGARHVSDRRRAPARARRLDSRALPACLPPQPLVGGTNGRKLGFTASRFGAGAGAPCSRSGDSWESLSL
jgi:hypothetical protein